MLQPALTRSQRGIEDTLGVKLFDREAGGALTVSGNALLVRVETTPKPTITTTRNTQPVPVWERGLPVCQAVSIQILCTSI
jgi:hypothetical protein